MPKETLLVFRFSAMGDVAMCIPVVAQFCEQNKEIHIVFVTKSQFKALFPKIANLTIHAVDFKHKHKGVSGLYILYKELKQLNISYIADLHENLRTKLLKFFFFFSKVKKATIDKGRAAKRNLVINKDLSPLKHTTLRYEKVFQDLGFDFIFDAQKVIAKQNISSEILQCYPFLKDKKQTWLGIFPFAQHLQKVYPLEKMKKVIASLAQEDIQILIFGAGKEEQDFAESCTQFGTQVHSMIGNMRLEQEMQLISNLDLMISMDSAGMHLASIYGVPVISIWGATHPSAGFLGINQSLENSIQTDVECRPCAIYGNKPCARGDFACMERITLTQITDKVKELL